ncbi:GDP-mannose 4,6-dehydratase [Posidoniimonas polymericola]|uniref:GDP-mannose 4,6-dehydratase n=1 Tax=Posidoniimonas polymericola TaxID=2528002 RepID=A0A5C5YSX7_9BACT|nr:GDP-mannose 4,6-dehydratase [Posidoniimonas polymericola]TWT77833.1 GDP-mannose 4,6-dehydratase [Posidoniimonas polymericola]
MAKTALITGITGQDGSYLAELLLAKGYTVWGMIRRASSINTGRIDGIYRSPQRENTHRDARLRLVYGDLADGSVLNRHVKSIRPDEVYNLGAQTHVKVSFELPVYTGDVTGLGAVRLLEALRECGHESRFYQASSSELFGLASESPQNEQTPFHPRSPYACAKAYAFHLTRNYRESYGMFAVNGIQYNHESPRRGEAFVTRKITRAAAAIALGQQETVSLGNLNAERDWGYAGDYVKAMWLMMQAERPQDYVVATGETHSVRDFCCRAFARAGVPLTWHGEGVNEHGVDQAGRVRVSVDPEFFRPVESECLRGDASRIRRELGWAPEHTFDELVGMMVDADLAALSGGRRGAPSAGKRCSNAA